jgi:hypothetical protein
MDSGYGRTRRQGRKVYAHRVAWEHANGTIPAIDCLVNLCGNRACINPDHWSRVPIECRSIRGAATSRPWEHRWA